MNTEKSEQIKAMQERFREFLTHTLQIPTDKIAETENLLSCAQNLIGGEELSHFQKLIAVPYIASFVITHFQLQNICETHKAELQRYIEEFVSIL